MKRILPSLLFLLLHCAMFAQSGIVWDATMDVAMGMYGNRHPRIALDGGGDPVILWGKASTNEVMLSKWTGSAFSTPLTVNPPASPAFTASWAGPDLAAAGDTVYVVYKVTPEDTNHIYCARSMDGGMNFSAPVRVDYISDSVCRFPTIIADDAGHPIIAFMKFNSMFMDARWVVTRSNDWGQTFAADTRASGWSGGDVCDCCPGGLVARGNDVAMLYRDNASNTRDSWAGISTDGGNTFSGGLSIDQNNWMLNFCPSTGPDGVIIDDTLYTVFMNGATGTDRVYWSKASLPAMNAQQGQFLTGAIPGLNMQNYPRIAHSGRKVAIVWRQEVNGSDELALLFTQDILNGLPGVTETVDMDDLTNCDVALDNGVIHVIWEDPATGTVKYRRGTFTPVVDIDQGRSIMALQAYPNPSAGKWRIEGPGLADAVRWELWDVQGRLIQSHALDWMGTNEFEMQGEALPSGIYCLRIAAAGRWTEMRLVKE